MMPDDLIEPYSVQEIFVDGFTSHHSHDGVMTCVGYRQMDNRKVVVVRLVWPAMNTNAAITSAMQALDAVLPMKRSAH